jgi:hypothetical protein
MKKTNQFWTLQEVFLEALTRQTAGENIKEIAFDKQFNQSHFKPLASFILAIEKQAQNGQSN